ncbi:MAG TPA: DUF664 domain-containing protein [Candidatus Acidoferrum sp.]|nr:DUF664 domain-containing protein [Candidatus Acidoferrum sp.]
MIPPECWPNRRSFLKMSAALTAGFTALPLLAQPPDANDSNTIVGPKKGYSPEIGTLVSMMGFTRFQVLMSAKGLTPPQLDFLLDDKANRIGALLMHLAAIETFFQLNTFDGLKWDARSDSIKQKWDVAGSLGEPARKAIKGNDLDYYLNLLKETREKTLAEFRKRDDKWLMAVDKDWAWGPTNNYCKWFHVAEHESNHNGQIKLLKSRVPGAKPAAE